MVQDFKTGWQLKDNVDEFHDFLLTIITAFASAPNCSESIEIIKSVDVDN